LYWSNVEKEEVQISEHLTATMLNQYYLESAYFSGKLSSKQRRKFRKIISFKLLPTLTPT